MIDFPPRLDLARLPTPLTRLERLAAEFPGVEFSSESRNVVAFDHAEA